MKREFASTLRANRNTRTIDAAELQARIDALVDVVVGIYAPLSGPGLSNYVRRLRYAAPQWQDELTKALQRAKERLAHAQIEAVDWYWPANEKVVRATTHGYGAIAGAFRSGGARPRALREVMGLGLSLRSLHADLQTQTRLLRHAVALA